MKKIFGFSEISPEIQDGRSTIQILKTGTFRHPVYGEFEITRNDLKEFQSNFEANKRGVDLAVDENHDGNHKAVGWYKKVFQDGDKLFAVIEWTKTGLELLKEKVYRYFSPELFFDFQDEESGETIKNLLIGGGITNRPFFKNMEALAACETTDTTPKKFYFLNVESMRNFKELTEALKSKQTLSFSELSEVRLAFSSLDEAEQTENLKDLKDLENKFSDDETAGENSNGESGENKDGEGENKGTEENGEAKPNNEDNGQNNEDKGQGEENKGGENQTFSGIDINSKEFSEFLKNSVGLDLEGVKNLQKSFSDMAAAKKKEDIEKKVGNFIFNETTKQGFILPKGKDKITAFVSKLSDNLVNEFFEILPQAVKSISYNEIGKQGDKAANSFNVPSTTPAGHSRESFVINEVAKQYNEQNKCGIENAMLYAEKIVKEQGIK